MRSSCTLNVQPTAFLFALPVPAIRSPAWFILSAYAAFATSGDALIGLSLLSILGRRSWIVSLAPSYMPFFCVSIIQRTSFLWSEAVRPARTFRGSGIRNLFSKWHHPEYLKLKNRQLRPIHSSQHFLSCVPTLLNPLVFADLRGFIK